ncbi:hypothetical protein GPAL_1363 [Glaciecola pallidula DSM 14239 = ACAM 615]|uniref:Uncharacterized protein n=1 Tax=Brumicola pallidula DSM 14239 = ACAM 615 TaxID=1121922 RepID=K6YW66_9ALTE|nr:hypothetical protein GPAL_1363 [Glaciecola pallidula DSM 14239 = ACAM 615]
MPLHFLLIFMLLCLLSDEFLFGLYLLRLNLFAQHPIWRAL